MRLWRKIEAYQGGTLEVALWLQIEITFLAMRIYLTYLVEKRWDLGGAGYLLLVLEVHIANARKDGIPLQCHIIIKSKANTLPIHSVESPSHSFRSYSVSSSDNEGGCSAIANCITRKLSIPPPRANSSYATSSKVAPQPSSPGIDDMAGPPRLVRSRALRRDLVRDWNFDGAVMER
ncbi:hypothetical protein DKX38_020052 [Salix brachista]|uniref:Uncharacterized protein n=1 Tax=Salix brachista TaxID=2182728 RepID=A0A5N5KI27_9ROSI|nr:hypothetical protein DKX38_020052 [Salix brachista]